MGHGRSAIYAGMAALPMSALPVSTAWMEAAPPPATPTVSILIPCFSKKPFSKAMSTVETSTRLLMIYLTVAGSFCAEIDLPAVKNTANTTIVKILETTRLFIWMVPLYHFLKYGLNALV
jgi:hypothetical protein